MTGGLSDFSCRLIDLEARLYNLGQKLFAEMIGTFMLVFVAAGTVCADQYLRPAGQVATGGLLASALAYGLASAVLISALSHVSGAHLNPAVTIGCWVTRRMTTPSALLYCVAQLVGGIAAAYLLSITLPDSVWMPAALGTPDLVPDFTRIHAMLLEGTLTLFLVFVYFASVIDIRGTFHKLGA